MVDFVAVDFVAVDVVELVDLVVLPVVEAVAAALVQRFSKYCPIQVRTRKTKLCVQPFGLLNKLFPRFTIVFFKKTPSKTVG